MVRFYENPTKHSGVIKEIFKERDVFPLPSFFFLLSFFFYCFPSLEDTHIIKKCYFTKTAIHIYDYIQLAKHLVPLIGKELSEHRSSCHQGHVASMAVINSLILRNI